MSFPDSLPELTPEQRTRMNKTLIANLAQALGWSRVPE